MVDRKAYQIDLNVECWESANRQVYALFEWRGRVWAMEPLQNTVSNMRSMSRAVEYMGRVYEGLERSWIAYHESKLWC